MADSNNKDAYGRVSTVQELGQMLRTKRKSLGLTLERVAQLSNIGIRYLSELERGKQTIEMGKALKVLNNLGLELIVRPKRGIRLGVKDE